MKTSLFLFMFCFLIAGQAICQTRFIRTYSGFPSFASIKKCSDKGYIISGQAYYSSIDAAIFKADSLGHMIWERKLEQWNYEGFSYAEETHDGGYIAVGYNQGATPSGSKIMLAKFTSTGIQSWNRSISLPRSHSYGLIVHEDQDHGFTVAGYNRVSFPNDSSTCHLVKTDSMGQVIWGRVFGLPLETVFKGACRTTDGGYVFLNHSQLQSTSTNIIIMKADKAGNFLWAKTIGGTSDEFAYGITATSHNGVMLAGTTTGYNCDSADILLISVDSTGSIIWAKTYGAPGQDQAHSVLQTKDGGFILSGSIGQGALHNNKGLALKTNANGFMHWAKTYIAGNRYPTYVIEQADDGGYAIAGAVSDTVSSASLIKTDASGNSCDDAPISLWWQSISIPSSAITVFIDSGGTSTPVSLPVTSFSGEYLLCMTPVDVPELPELGTKVSVYPNPSYDGRFTVDVPSRQMNGTIDVFNSLGQKVRSAPLSKTMDLSDLPKGVYHYSILLGESQERVGGTVVYR